MNITDYATIVLRMNDSEKRKQAVEKLKYGLKHEKKWDDSHKREVKQLINFLSSESNDIEDLELYNPQLP